MSLLSLQLTPIIVLRKIYNSIDDYLITPYQASLDPDYNLLMPHVSANTFVPVSLMRFPDFKDFILYF